MLNHNGGKIRGWFGRVFLQLNISLPKSLIVFLKKIWLGRSRPPLGQRISLEMQISRCHVTGSEFPTAWCSPRCVDRVRTASDVWKLEPYKIRFPFLTSLRPPYWHSSPLLPLFPAVGAPSGKRSSTCRWSLNCTCWWPWIYCWLLVICRVHG